MFADVAAAALVARRAPAGAGVHGAARKQAGRRPAFLALRVIDDFDAAAGPELSRFGTGVVAAQHGVDGVRDALVDGNALPAFDFDDDIEGRRRFAFEDRLLRAAAARFFVPEGNRLDAADQVGER